MDRAVHLQVGLPLCLKVLSRISAAFICHAMLGRHLGLSIAAERTTQSSGRPEASTRTKL